eukprot:4950959-Pyramimonas_sp.AAC.1
MTGESNFRVTRWLDKVLTVNSTVAVSSPSGVRKELVGDLNSRVTRWLDKVLTVDSTVAVSSPFNPIRGERIYP